MLVVISSYVPIRLKSQYSLQKELPEMHEAKSDYHDTMAYSIHFGQERRVVTNSIHDSTARSFCEMASQC